MTDKSLEVPNITLCRTESFESKQGGPQTKIYDILKALVEEKAVFLWNYSGLNALNLSKNRHLTPFSLILINCSMNLGKLRSFDIIRLEIKYIFNNVDAHNLKFYIW